MRLPEQRPFPTGFTLGLRPPEEAVAAFEGRRLLASTFSWQDLWQQQHARAFAVAGLYRADLLQALYDGLGAAIAQGSSLKQFADRVRPILQAGGFWGDRVPVTDLQTGETRTTRVNAARLQLIFDVNLRQSYAAGTWSRIERDRERKPYVLYRTMQDERVRQSHAEWDGVCLPVGDAFWETHYPPNGWRCRCRAFSLDQRAFDRLKAAGSIKTEAPPVDLVDYERRLPDGSTTEIRVPKGIDPGWAYNPGQARASAAQFDQAALTKLTATQPEVAAETWRQALVREPLLAAQALTAWQTWLAERSAARAKPRGEVFHLGTLPPAIVDELRQAGRPVSTAVLTLRDSDLSHILRDAKSSQVDATLLQALPSLLRAPRAILRERATGTLLYVFDGTDGSADVGKLVVELGQIAKAPAEGAGRQRVQFNRIKTFTRMDGNALRDVRQYEVLFGSVR